MLSGEHCAIKVHLQIKHSFMKIHLGRKSELGGGNDILPFSKLGLVMWYMPYVETLKPTATHYFLPLVGTIRNM